MASISELSAVPSVHSQEIEPKVKSTSEITQKESIPLSGDPSTVVKELKSLFPTLPHYEILSALKLNNDDPIKTYHYIKSKSNKTKENQVNTLN